MYIDTYTTNINNKVGSKQSHVNVVESINVKMLMIIDYDVCTLSIVCLIQYF